MTTILVINAVSSLLATVSIGGWLVWQDRARRETFVQPLYVTTRVARPLPRG
jgi:hypothetical protein